MEEKYRTLSGEFRNLKKENEFMYSIECWLLNGKVNRNGWQYENLAKHRPMFANIPILVAYVNDGRTIGDGHNFSMEPDPNKPGETRPTFVGEEAERISGATSWKEEDIRLEEKDGVSWIVAKAYLWRWYCASLVDKIENMAAMGRQMELSIETLISEYSVTEDGVEHEVEWIPLGVTLLGDAVQPAVADAHIRKLSQSEEFKSMTLRAASYLAPSEEEKKPQHNNSKGVKEMEQFNAVQLRKLAEKFPDYTVLAAGKEDETTCVCMMNASGDFFEYKMDSENETIVPEKMNAVDVSAISESKLVFTLTESMRAQERTLSKKVDDLEKENAALVEEKNTLTESLNTALETVRVMQEAENNRRVQAVKEKANSVLEEFNRNRMDKVSEEKVSKIFADADKGVYTNSLNEDGQWNGLERVEDAVLALCAKEEMEIRKVHAAQNAKAYAWDMVSGDSGKPVGESDVADLLNSFGID